jgi:hypothetical protein
LSVLTGFGGLALGAAGKVKDSPAIGMVDFTKAEKTEKKMKGWGEGRGAKNGTTLLGADEGEIEALVLFEAVIIAEGFDELEGAVITSHENVLTIVQGGFGFCFSIAMGTTTEIWLRFEKFHGMACLG